MLDKKSYQILKNLYKVKRLSKLEIEVLTEKNFNQGYHEDISFLLENKMVDRFVKHGAPDGESGYAEPKDEDIFYKITKTGSAYIEQRRRDGRNFWVPYIITTLIALASVLASILSALQ